VVIEPTADWLTGGPLNLYRYLEAGAGYAPDSPYATSGGRFDNGRRLTVYLASSPEGAVAEFLRRHPELLALQEFLRIQVFEVRVRIVGRCLDIRSPDQASQAGVDLTTLASDHPDEAVRYGYWRELADLVNAEAGIAYPSAAHQRPASCLVLFGSEGERWVSEGFEEIPRPTVDTAAVIALST
jgi:RES domain-containing protein